MYCNRCGRYIEYGVICSECANREAVYAPPQQRPPQPQYNAQPQTSTYASNLPEPYNSRYGFGSALLSMIFGIISLELLLGVAATVDVVNDAALIFIVMSVPFIIVSLVKGANSIKLYIRRRKVCVPPRSALIFGRLGVIFSGISATFDILMLIYVLTSI